MAGKTSSSKDNINVDVITNMFSDMCINLASSVRNGFVSRFKEISEKDADEIVEKILMNFTGSPDYIRGKMVTLNPRKKEIAEGEGCIFELTRGPRKGKTCNKSKHRDSDYCPIHRKSLIRKGVVLESKSIFKEIEISGMEDVYRYGSTPYIVAPKNMKKPIGQNNFEIVGKLDFGAASGEMRFKDSLSSADKEYFTQNNISYADYMEFK